MMTAAAIGLLAHGDPARADQLTLTYDFEQPEVSQVLIAGQLYDHVTMNNCAGSGMPGEPELPACGAQILLPPGAEVLGVEVMGSRIISMGEGFFIKPVIESVPLSQVPEMTRPPLAAPAVYKLHTRFPDATFEEVGTFSFRGYRILTVKLQPVSYVPASGELSWYPRLTVVVNTSMAAGPSEMFRGLDTDEQAAMGKVDNPAMMARYPEARSRDEGYDLLIITTPSFAPSFESLRDYHNAHDIQTAIHTTDDVGSTDPVVIRDYIRDRYLNDGIEYVIIGGDDDIIPCKDLHVDTIDDMPGDVFYSCLDGSWNWDNDNYWGEPEDGEGGGDVDLVAEVYVGRACVGNTTEIARFVAKTLWYLNGGHTTPNHVLLPGEYLGFGGVGNWGGNYLDEFIDGSSEHGYTTVGFPTDTYHVETLYERDVNWGKWDLIDRLDAGIHAINHMGHGEPDYAMHLYSSDVLSDVHNTDLCFVYSQSCFAGHLDSLDCWAEHMNVKIDAGAYALIMNARYGWGKYESTDGPSQRFAREFWDAVFNPLEGIGELGKANADSKEDNIYRINEEHMRWCFYGLNLFGDPTLAFREVADLGLYPAPDYYSKGPNGGPFNPESKIYTLKNNADYPIEYAVGKTAAWIDLDHTSGTLPPGDTADVMVSINSQPDHFPNGQYEDLVAFVNETNNDGDTARMVTLKVGIPIPMMTFDLSSDPGWSTEGQWAYGHPTGGGGTQHGYPDPDSGYTGDNVYGYNLNGDYADDVGGPYYLTTNALDCSDLTEVCVRFMRWLNCDYQPYVLSTLEASADGLNWTPVWGNGDEEIEENAWSEQIHDISAVADNQATVHVRWGHEVAWSSAVPYSGWNLDDIEIWGIHPSQGCPWDTNDTGTVDIDDVFEILDLWGEAGGPGDVNRDGVVDIDDVFDVLANWGPCP